MEALPCPFLEGGGMLTWFLVIRKSEVVFFIPLEWIQFHKV
jgi:hypothetical protein